MSEPPSIEPDVNGKSGICYCEEERDKEDF